MPKVSQMKIDLVKAVIPDKDKVGCLVLENMPGLKPLEQLDYSELFSAAKGWCSSSHCTVQQL